jgi:hypothetical protein
MTEEILSNTPEECIDFVMGNVATGLGRGADITPVFFLFDEKSDEALLYTPLDETSDLNEVRKAALKAYRKKSNGTLIFITSCKFTSDPLVVGPEIENGYNGVLLVCLNKEFSSYRLLPYSKHKNGMTMLGFEVDVTSSLSDPILPFMNKENTPIP